MDVCFRGAQVLDGTGKAAFCADVAVQAGRIARIGPALSGRAATEVDARGLCLTPGFIDLHRHGDLVPFTGDGQEVRQGITTFINGNCGFSALPCPAAYFSDLVHYARPILGRIPQVLCGQGLADLLSQNQGLYSHMGYLVGNGTLRIAVKGFDPSPMTAAQLAQVQGLLRQELDAGAFGLSLGLMYVPENYYTTEELVEICKVVAQAGRLVTVHMRGEGASLLSSLKEVVHLARHSGAAFHVSHLKAAGKANWGRVSTALDILEQARAEGPDLSFDVYPYSAGSTALYTLLPPDLQAGGLSALLPRLREKALRQETAQALRQEQKDWDNLIASTGWQSVAVVGGSDVSLYGMTVADIARQRGTSPEETVFDLLLENGGDVPIVFHSMSEEDVQRVITAPGALVVSDALYSEKGLPHPRKYGSQIRFLRRYGPLLGREKALAALTGLPARRLNLAQKGRIAPGCDADLCLLDWDKLQDTATYQDPRQFPRGIRAVYVAGQAAFTEDGGLQATAGQMLRAQP